MKNYLKRVLNTIVVCLFQVLVINRITPKSFKNLQLPDGMDQPLPIIKPDPLISNIYSIGERILLTWLNHCYSHNKDKIWNGYGRDSAPARWIVNFDIDVTDSLALGATIGAYCPFLVNEKYLNLIKFFLFILIFSNKFK